MVIGGPTADIESEENIARKPVDTEGGTLCEATSAQGALMAVQIAELVNRQENAPLDDKGAERLLTSQRLMRDIQANFSEIGCEGRVPVFSVITPVMTIQQAGPILASMSKTPAEKAVLEGILRNGYMLKRKPLKWRNPQTQEVTVVEPTPTEIEIESEGENFTIQYEQSRLAPGDGRVRERKGEFGVFYAGVEISADRLAKETLLVKPNMGNRIVTTVDRRIVRKLLKRLDPEFYLDRAVNRFLAPITRLLTTERYPVAWTPTVELTPDEIGELRKSVFPQTADQATREMAKSALGVSRELANISDKEIKRMMKGEVIPGSTQMNVDDLIRLRLISELLDRGALVEGADENYYHFTFKEQALGKDYLPIEGKFFDRKVKIARFGALTGPAAEIGKELRSARGSGIKKLRFGASPIRQDIMALAEDITDIVTVKFVPDPIPSGMVKEGERWKQVAVTPAVQAECMQILAFGQSNGIGITRTMRFYGDDPTFGGTVEGLVPGLKCNTNTRNTFSALRYLVKFPLDALSMGAILPSSDIALALLANDQRMTTELVKQNIRFACARKTPLPTLDTSRYDFEMVEKNVIIPDMVLTGDYREVTWKDGDERPRGTLRGVDVQQIMGKEAYQMFLNQEGAGQWNIQNTATIGASYNMPKELLLHKARMMAKAGITSPTRMLTHWGYLGDEVAEMQKAGEELEEAVVFKTNLEEELRESTERLEGVPADSQAREMAEDLLKRTAADLETAEVIVAEKNAIYDEKSEKVEFLGKVESNEAMTQWARLTNYITNIRKVWPNEVVLTGYEDEPMTVRGLFGQFQAVFDVTSVDPEFIRGLPKEGIWNYDKLCAAALKDQIKIGKDDIDAVTEMIQSKVEGQTLQDAVIEEIGPEEGEEGELPPDEVQAGEPMPIEESELVAEMRGLTLPPIPEDALIYNPIDCLTVIIESLARRPMIGRMLGITGSDIFERAEVPDDEEKNLGKSSREVEIMISLLDQHCGTGFMQWVSEEVDDSEKIARVQLVKNRAALDLEIIKTQRALDNLSRLTGVLQKKKQKPGKQREQTRSSLERQYSEMVNREEFPDLIPYLLTQVGE